MNFNDFSRKVTEEVREKLPTIAELNDEIAMMEIISTVFDNPSVNEYSEESISELIDLIFLKTRRRLGILDPLINDKNITEIMVNGPSNIFYEKYGIIEKYPYSFESVEELEEVMQAIAGDVHREINEMNPIVDARLKDGSRVNGVYKNIAVNGPTLTIRKFPESYITLDDMVRSGTITEDAKILLETLVICGYNIFISGGTSSGKTTFLNAIAESIPKEERVIVIEDSMELQLDYIENIVHMECRNANSRGQGKVNMSQLIKSSLRMRPNRIIVGEVRGEEVLDMINAMNTGHQGSLSTGHGNSVVGMLKRLETMYLQALPISADAIRQQIAEGIDIMVHLERQENKERKVVEIVELLDYKDGEFVLNTLFKMDAEKNLIRQDTKLMSTRKVILKGKEYAERLQQIGFI